MHITIFLQVQFMFIFLLLPVPSIDFQLLPFYLSLAAEGDLVTQKVHAWSLGMAQGALNLFQSLDCGSVLELWSSLCSFHLASLVFHLMDTELDWQPWASWAPYLWGWICPSCLFRVSFAGKKLVESGVLGFFRTCLYAPAMPANHYELQIFSDFIE